MPQFEIRPQEIYLLERYSSVEYFNELVDAFKNMLDVAENALELFMQDLPYDYRNRHISQQPDVVWGKHVLPNFMSTFESLNYGYKRLLIVVIDYFDGDIDRPFVLGRIHEAQRSPTKFDIKGQLPHTRHLSGIRSEEIQGSGYNQLRFDDTTGQISSQLHSSR